MSELFSLNGRRALVTGSSQGIGMALAQGLAEAGAQIVLNGRDMAKLEAARDVLKAAGADVHMLAFDVTDHDAVRAAVDGFEADLGAIDVLVNNAGMQHRTPLEDFPADAFEKLLQTNVASVFHVGQACARHMIGRKVCGKIINIASVQTALARPGIAPYTDDQGRRRQPHQGHGDGLGKAWAPGATPSRPATSTPRSTRRSSADPEFSAPGSRSAPPRGVGARSRNSSARLVSSSPPNASSFVNGHTLLCRRRDHGKLCDAAVSLIMGVSGMRKDVRRRRRFREPVRPPDLYRRGHAASAGATSTKMSQAACPWTDLGIAMPWLADVVGEALGARRRARRC